MEKQIKVEGVEMDRDDLTVLQHHYLTVMSDIVLLVELASARGKSVEGAYLDCKERVKELAEQIKKLDEKK